MPKREQAEASDAGAASLAVFRQVNPVMLKLNDADHILTILGDKIDLLNAEMNRWTVLLQHLRSDGLHRSNVSSIERSAAESS